MKVLHLDDQDYLRRLWLRTLIALATTAQSYVAPPAARIAPKNTRRYRRTDPHQGTQEMARRRRRIAHGTLTRSNGLAV